MKKNAKLRNRIIAISAAATVFVGTLWGALNLTKDSAYASRVTLKGIDALATAHSITSTDSNPDPFIILEVVPDKSQAMMGYLVGGEEPVYEGKSIKDMPSSDERILRFNQFKDGVMDATASETQAIRDLRDASNPAFSFSEYDETATSASSRYLELRGYFKKTEDGKGEYAANDYKSAFVTFEQYCSDRADDLWNSGSRDPEDYEGYADVTTGPSAEDPDIEVVTGYTPYGTVDKIYADSDVNHNVKNIKLYRKTITFRPSDDYFTGHYLLELQRVGSSSESMPIYSTNVRYINEPTSLPAPTEGPTTTDAIYNWQYFDAIKLTTLEQLQSLHEGQYIFRTNGSGDYLSYFGQVKNGKIEYYHSATDDLYTTVANLPITLLSEPDAPSEIPEPSPVTEPSGTDEASNENENTNDGNTENSQVATQTGDTASDNSQTSESVSDAESTPSSEVSPTPSDELDGDVIEEIITSVVGEGENRQTENTDNGTEELVNAGEGEEFAELIFDYSGIGLESFGHVAYMDGNGDGLDPSLRNTSTPTATPTATPDGISSGVTPAPSGSADPNATATPSATPEGTPGETATPSAASESTPVPTSVPSSTEVPSTTQEPSETEVPEATQEPSSTESPAESSNSESSTPENGGASSEDDVNPLIIMGASGQMSGLGILNAFRIGMMSEEAEYSEISRSTNYSYYVVDFTSNPSPDSYVISSVKWDDTGKAPFGKLIQYSEVYGEVYNSTNAPTEKRPYYVQTADQEEYIFKMDSDGNPRSGDVYSDLKWDYNFRADYSKEPFKKSYAYNGGFQNNEWFKKYVLDRTTDEEFKNLYIDVIPVTPDEIKDYIDEADLIYFAGGKRIAGTRQVEDTTEADLKDIDAETAIKILDKVVNNNFPVIIERSAYFTNLNLEKNELVASVEEGWSEEQKAIEHIGDEKVNLTLLMLELMQDSVAVMKEALNPDNWAAYTEEFAQKPYSEVVVTDSVTGQKRGGIRTNRVIVDTEADVESANEIPETLISNIRSKLIQGIYRTHFDTPGTKDVSFVHGTVFVNDDWNDAEWEYGEPGWKVVAPDFNTDYSEDKVKGIGGFDEITAEYAEERTIIETYANWADFNSALSKATSIRYILNANNNRYSIKSSLRILDLEPMETAQFQNQNSLFNDVYMNSHGGTLWNLTVDQNIRDTISKDWIWKNIDVDKTVTDENLNIVQMGTKEFIGKNDDLNVNYDMIYIGMDTLLMNTDNTAYPTKATETIYNDSGMHGLVYSHMGDKYNTKVDQTGSSSYNTDTRLSGNDITKDKLRELQEYVQAGYSVLLSDGFFSTDTTGKITGINRTTVDSSSNMYKFMEFVMKKNADDGSYLYLGKNVFRRGDLEDDGNTGTSVRVARETFVKYLNISKLVIKVDNPSEDLPQAYNDDGRKVYLSPDSTGQFALKYKVTLENDSALSAAGITYDCKLYLDLDADGKFEDSEAQAGLTVTTGDGQVGQGDDGRYHLTTGNTYYIERYTPEEYVGFISWKLEFTQNEKALNEAAQGSSSKANIRAAISGFSAVPNQGDRPQIDVLQIYSSKHDNRNTMDLASSEFTGSGALYDQVKDFKVNIHKVSVDDYIKKNDTEYQAADRTYVDYLSQFDMVVIGFSDDFEFVPENIDWSGNITVKYPSWYRDTNQYGQRTVNATYAIEDALLGIREYALSGRSILFSHDLSNTQQDASGRRALTNLILRDIMGMDRYGIRQSANASLSYHNDMTIKEGTTDHQNHDNVAFPENYNSVYDYASQKGNDDQDTFGFTDFHIARYKQVNYEWAINTRLVTRGNQSNGNDLIPWNQSYGSGWNSQTETVTAINEGQITQYPFLITTGTGGTYRYPSEEVNSGKWNPTFEIAATHAQYYQLNLDTDSTDENGNDDVVVWYTISNSGVETGNHYGEIHSYYQALHNDVRNNYFIYSKGNVLYTGAGHWYVHDDQERKLFVNTLVASYVSGLHAPKVVFKENPWDSSATIMSTHLPFDPNLTLDDTKDDELATNSAETGGFLDTKMTVNFKTLNNDFKDSNAKLNVKYYVKTDDPTKATLTIGSMYYQEVNPTVKVADVTGSTFTAVADSHSLENYRIYQMELNVSDLNVGGGKGILPKEDATIYVHVGTEDLSSGNIPSLQATESIAALDVYTARLYDLE